MTPVSIIGSVYLYREFFYWEYWSDEGWAMLVEYHPRSIERPPKELPDWGGATVPPPAPDVLAIAGMIRRGEYDRLEFLGRRAPAALDAFADTSPDLEDALDTWVRKRPGSILARLTRAAYWQRIGQARRGGDWSALTSKAQFQGMEDAYARAEADLIEAIRRDPGLRRAYPRLIWIYTSARSRRSELRAIWRRAVEAGAGTTELHRALFVSLSPRWSGIRVADSIAAIEKVLDTIEDGSLRGSADLELLRAYPDFVRAEALSLDGDQRGAIEIYARLVEGPARRFLLDDYARALQAAGRLGSALNSYAASLSINPSDPDILGEYARLLYRTRHYAEAARAAESALAVDPYDPDALLVSGNLDVVRGDLDKARDSFERAMVHGGERKTIMVRLFWVRNRLSP